MIKLLTFITFCFISISYANSPDPVFVEFKGHKITLTKKSKSYLNIEVSEFLEMIRSNHFTFDLKVLSTYTDELKKNSYSVYFKRATKVLDYLVESFEKEFINVSYEIIVSKIEEKLDRHNKEGVYVLFSITNTGVISD